MARVLVIGAGPAGLLAARELQGRGHEVTVLDKGHRPGGRMASRRVGEAVFDTGAQFITTKSERFAAHVAAWRAHGAAAVWFHGAPDADGPVSDADGPVPDADGTGDGHPRYRGVPAMRSIPEHLAAGLDVRLARRVTGVAGGPGGWRVVSVARGDEDDREELGGDALLISTPVPQTLELLAAGGAALSGELGEELTGITYVPTIALLVVPRSVPRLGARGAVRLAEGPVGFISDNQAKGVSPVPAVTIHAGRELSRRRWDDSDEVVADEVLAAARPFVGEADVVAVHRWRYATPLVDPPAGAPAARLAHAPRPVAFAGDAFAGGRVEGAALSGLQAADLLVDALA